MATESISYRASSNLTFTSLASLAHSASHIAGAESAAYDNSSNLDTDALLAGYIALDTSTGPAANTQILVYVVAEINDTTWPDVFDGTDSAETWTNVEMRDAAGKLAAVINLVENAASRVMPFHCGSVAALFGGAMPRKFVVWVTQNSGDSLAASGSLVSVTGIKRTSA